MSEENKPDGLDSLINSLHIRQTHGFRTIVSVNGRRSLLPDTILDEAEWEKQSVQMHANQARYEEETEKAAANILERS